MGPLNPDQAEEMLGAVIDVVNPSKGRWPEGPYKVTGYTLDPEDGEKVASLQAESLERVPERVVKDGLGREINRIPEHAAYRAKAIPVRWAKPLVDPGAA